jgi:competence protein ComEC
LRLDTAGSRVLLPGDVEGPGEADLADQDVSADVLKVSHHGSATSSLGRWLDRVRPRIAVISCGLHNRFGHPSPATLTALSERGIQVFRTDRSGAVTMELQPRGWVAHPMIGSTETPAAR